MRYYELDPTGKVKGHYAVLQPDKTLHHLDEAPDDASKRDGVPGTAWVPDQDIVDARLAVQVLASTKNQALEDLLPSWAQVKTYFDNLDIEVEAISNVATAKAAMAKIATTMRKLIRIEYLVLKNKVD